MTTKAAPATPIVIDGLPPAMTNRIFLRLGKNGALGADALQWILYKRCSEAGKSGVLFQGAGWIGVSFVRSTKAIVERCIRERGIQLSGEGAAEI